MRIFKIFLAALSTAAAAPYFTSSSHNLIVNEKLAVTSSINTFRGLKKVKKEDGSEVEVPDDVPESTPVPETPAEVSPEPTLPVVETPEAPASEVVSSPTEVSDEESDDKTQDDLEQFDETPDLESEEGEGVSPYVWYSVGGVIVAIIGYFACCRKSDNGYSRIQ